MPRRKKQGCSVDIYPEQVIGDIDRYIYGSLVEPLGRCVYGGIWAEMLNNRKFAVSSEDREMETPKWWFPYSKNKSITYTVDRQTFCSAPSSLKMSVLPEDGEIKGISQHSIHVLKGRKYVVSLYLKQENLQGEVLAALCRKSEILTSHPIKNVASEWRRYSFTLIPSKDEVEAQFIVVLRGTGSFWIDSVSLMPEDNVYGMRRDILEAIKQIGLTMVRLPGGGFSDEYHWVNGIGPRDKRPAVSKPTYSSGWRFEQNDFGTDEFLKFCKVIGCEAYINVNFGSGTPEEAAQWVDYCNGDPASYWGSMRAKNGHSDPYGVTFWGIGNEIYGQWEVGHTDAHSYGKRFRQFHDAMKKIDPGIKLIAVGCKPHPRVSTSWNVGVLKEASEKMDYLSIHKYIPGAGATDVSIYSEEQLYDAIVSAPVELERMLTEVWDIITTLTSQKTNIKIALDEWNVWTKATLDPVERPGVLEGEDYNLRDAICAAGILNVLQKLCNQVKIGIQSLLVNALGSVVTNKIDTYTTSIAKVLELYIHHTGQMSVKSYVESETFNTTLFTEEMYPLSDITFLDCSATMDFDGCKMFVAVINRSRDLSMPCELRVHNRSPKPLAKIWELNGPEWTSKNSFESKNEVRTIEKMIDNASPCFRYEFPAHSITIIELELD